VSIHHIDDDPRALKDCCLLALSLEIAQSLAALLPGFGVETLDGRARFVHF